MNRKIILLSLSAFIFFTVNADEKQTSVSGSKEKEVSCTKPEPLNKKDLKAAIKDIKLLADDAVCRGCQKDSAILGYWNKNGSAEWDFKIRKPGKRYLIIEYTAPQKTTIYLSIPHILSKNIKLDATGGWSSFIFANLTTADFPAGSYKIKVKRKTDGSFLNLQSITIAAAPLKEPLENIGIYVKKATWPLSMTAMRNTFMERLKNPKWSGAEFSMEEDLRALWRDFPKETDWFIQDNQVNDGWVRAGFDARNDFRHYLQLDRDTMLEQTLIRNALKDIGPEKDKFQKEFEKLIQNDTSPDSPEWLKLYVRIATLRREKRLVPLLAKTDKIIYATHMNLGIIYLETETQGCPDGSELRIIDLTPEKNGKPLKDELLFDSKSGIVRDPELSFDAKKLLFAWRKTNEDLKTIGKMAPKTGNYKIYEMDLATREIRQLTDDTTYGADFEPCYLPNGDIMFSSTRCVQEVTCGWGDASNLYIMNRDGKYARRLGFDQTQTAFPHLLDDGRIVYTRRDYNDRGQTYAHALFVMNVDGTFQTEYYGNNTSEPTSLQHTRQIPGTGKTMAIAGGYHTSQGGKLLIINPKDGVEEYQGLKFINWDYTKKIFGGDHYGREGDQYAYPYPFSEDEFLISYEPFGGHLLNKEGKVTNRSEQGTMLYKLYFMRSDGTRELLASNPTLSCTQGIPVISRKPPILRASGVDYKKESGIMYVQNVYFGPSAEGIKPGTIKKIRVNEIYYKPVTIGGACWAPPRSQVGPGKKYSSVGQHSVTPVGVGTASFDAKRILGEIDVHEDGSAMFEVPARTPIYLQLIDDKGHVAQSMRSWATLMPNEKFSCVGCHENKNNTPLTMKRTMAMQRAPQKLKSFYDISDRPFSYAKMIQPIFNKHCVSCHAPGKKAAKIDLSDNIVIDDPDHHGNSATQRKFYQSYLTLLKVKVGKGEGKRRAEKRLTEGTPNKWVDYYTRLLTVERTPPYYAGSCNSGLLKMLEEGHHNVKISREELDKIAAWMDLNVPFIGEYDEMNNWTDKSKEFYKTKTAMRKKMEKIELENIKEYIDAGQP
jgi:hypothetical protein